MLLNSDRFCDASPRQVYATLLDEGRYVCHWRTMYRILGGHDEVRERRNQLRHPRYKKPELLARGPNELWSWDITKLRGPQKWTYYYLYVIMDVYSRYVVGWMIAPREQATLAKELIETTCERQGIARDRLIIHSDRGPSMISKTVAQLLADLGVEKSHSRPYVPNDNPYSEAQFKTMKYRPDYPDRFGSIEDARQWARGFFGWYNGEHYHSALGLLTPEMVHYGEAERVRTQRQRVLEEAYTRHSGLLAAIPRRRRCRVRSGSMHRSPSRSKKPSNNKPSLSSRLWTLWAGRSAAKGCPQVQGLLRRRNGLLKTWCCYTNL